MGVGFVFDRMGSIGRRKGFETSGTVKLRMAVRWIAGPCAIPLGRQPNGSTTAMTWRLAGPISPLSFTTRKTVLIETPASRAASEIVIGSVIEPLSAFPVNTHTSVNMEQV